MRGGRRVYHELDNYSIEREIGHGSFAIVYKAYEKVSLDIHFAKFDEFLSVNIMRLPSRQ